MKHLQCLSIGCMILLLPTVASAASIFDTFYDDASSTAQYAPVSTAIVQFTIQQMRLWGPHGIVLTPDDIALAQKQDPSVCVGKKDVDGHPLAPMDSGAGTTTCNGLLQAINGLIESERDTQQLGDTLITIANGNEMAIADEPHRGSNIGQLVTTFSRLWTGTGSDIAPWPADANDAVQSLDDALSAEKADLDGIILRFHHGYFRDLREHDPQFETIGPKTKAALGTLAAILGINGDPTKTGDIATPVLRTPNVTLWARRDDLGLQWTYPTHLERINIQSAWAYPERSEGGQLLAYPFSYQGDVKPNSTSTFFSPLCSRSSGRLGFLCRALPKVETCNSGSGSLLGISLVQCTSTVMQSNTPPQICSGSLLLYKDTNQNLTDAKITDRANPRDICSPESKILYPDDTAHHACYINYCLRQSMSGHTLMPLRNTTLMNEPAAPVNAFARNDPQLGLYAEMNSITAPVNVPAYLGLNLINEFERDYCAQNGLPPSPLAGLCNFQNARRDASPVGTLNEDANAYVNEQLTLSNDLGDTSALGAAAGFRLSLDQSLPIYQTMAATLAQTVQNIANLFNELKSAPITRQLCPWIGAPTDSTNIPVQP